MYCSYWLLGRQGWVQGEAGELGRQPRVVRALKDWRLVLRMKGAAPVFGPEGLLLPLRAVGIPQRKGGLGRGKRRCCPQSAGTGRGVRVCWKHCWAHYLSSAGLQMPEKLVWGLYLTEGDLRPLGEYGLVPRAQGPSSSSVGFPVFVTAWPGVQLLPLPSGRLLRTFLQPHSPSRWAGWAPGEAWIPTTGSDSLQRQWYSWGQTSSRRQSHMKTLMCWLRVPPPSPRPSMCSPSIPTSCHQTWRCFLDKQTALTLEAYDAAVGTLGKDSQLPEEEFPPPKPLVRTFWVGRSQGPQSQEDQSLPLNPDVLSSILGHQAKAQLTFLSASHFTKDAKLWRGNLSPWLLSDKREKWGTCQVMLEVTFPAGSGC